MKVFLTGGNGFIGSAIRNHLLQLGCEVTICVRKINPALNQVANLHQIVLDFNDSTKSSDWIELVTGFDALINAVGIISESKYSKFSILHDLAPRALFQACKAARIKRIIQISALGADKNPVTQYQRSKKKADDYLKTLPLDWTIFYPSIVYGENDSSMTFFSALAALPVTGIIGNGSQTLQPIHIDDLALAVGIAVTQNKARKKSIFAVGKDEITFLELIKKLRSWLGLGKNICFSIPTILVRVVASLAQYIPGAMLTPETIIMLQQGNTAPIQGFVKAFGFTARGIKSHLVLNPANVQKRRAAGLYFFPGLLRLGIACVWLWSGIVSLWISDQRSYEILALTGLQGQAATIALYLGSLLDIVFSILVLIKWRPMLFSYFQAILILGYTAIVSFMIPEFWLDPFGSILKNLPLIVAIMILGVMDNDRH